jgi:hypothetical protein
MFKKTHTVEDWGKIEQEKIEQRSKKEAEIATLQDKRPALLERIATDEQPDFTELKRLDEQIAQLKMEIEVIDVLLTATIPAGKNYARGLQIEALIPTIEKRDAQFSAFVADINKKAAALAESNNSFRKFLEGFDGFESIRVLGLRDEFASFGLGAIARNSPSSGAAYSDPKTIDLAIVLMAAVYDKERFAEWVEKTRSSIAEKITRMRDHALRLKGEKLPSPAYPYCPTCYKITQAPDKNRKAPCSGCGKTIEPVY